MKSFFATAAVLACLVPINAHSADYVNCTGSTWNPAFYNVNNEDLGADKDVSVVRVFGWVRCFEPSTTSGDHMVAHVESQLHYRLPFGTWDNPYYFNEPCDNYGEGSTRANSGTGCDQSPDYYVCPKPNENLIWRTYTFGEGHNISAKYYGSLSDETVDDWAGVSNTVSYRCRPWDEVLPS